MNLSQMINSKIKRFGAVLIFLVISICIISPAHSATPLSGMISVNKTLTPEESPYIIEKTLVVGTGVTLSVSSGVVIKSSGPGILVDGVMNANDAVFTSIKDDSAGGDTNEDGENTLPSGGDWNGIVFQSGASGIIEGCTVRYGNYTTLTGISCDGQVSIFSNNVKIQNCTIQNGGKTGIYIKNSSPEITGNSVSGHLYISTEIQGGYGIYLRESAAIVKGNTVTDNQNSGIYVSYSPNAEISENQVYDNGKSGDVYKKGIYVYGDAISPKISANNGTDIIYLYGGTLSGVHQWDSIQPWVIGGKITVLFNGSLTIPENTVVKSTGSGIYVEGELNGANAVFTSVKDDASGGDSNGDGDSSVPEPGNWSGIFFKTGSKGGLNGCSLHYGRGFEDYSAQLVILSNSVSIQNSSITDGSESGIIIKDASPVIKANTVSGHVYKSAYYPGGHGIYLENSSSRITDNTVSNNGKAGIYITGSPGAVISGNSVNENGKSGDKNFKGIFLSGDSVNAQISGNTGTSMLYLDNGGILTTERTWDASHPWIIGWFTIGQAGKLSISANAVVKSKFWIYVEGELNAEDTVFTSFKDDSAGGDTNGDGSTTPWPGDWGGIAFATSSSGILDGCQIRYGGELNFDGTTYSGQLVILSDNISVTNSTVQNGAKSGIYVKGAAPALSGNQIISNLYGLYTRDTSFSLQGNSFLNNKNLGIYNFSSHLAIDARNNFWGNASGPKHTGNPEGTGDGVSNSVLFNPWSLSPSEDQLNLKHAITGLKITAGIQTNDFIGDLTGDGKTGIEDVIFILQKVAGLRQ